MGPERGPERAAGSCRRYANHGDLFKRLGRLKQKKQNLPEDAVWIYFIQLCLGVQALHKNNILHRDLKSANVFLASHNRLKIGDLGVAKLLKAQEAYAKTQIGTPYYVSPELWKNKPYNSKSDVWALGCLLCVPRRISRAESDLQPRTFVRRNHKRSSPSVGLSLSAWAALVGLSRHLAPRAPCHSHSYSRAPYSRAPCLQIRNGGAAPAVRQHQHARSGQEGAARRLPLHLDSLLRRDRARDQEPAHRQPGLPVRHPARNRPTLSPGLRNHAAYGCCAARTRAAHQQSPPT